MITFPFQELEFWYQQFKRDLPWRKFQDAYRVWVSEIMLQQTQVNNVIPYYQRFLKKFPTIEALAQAEEEEVLPLWSGLGYYTRARNLLKTARIVTEKFKGNLPSTFEELLKLPGIGPYTAGALLSIAYHLPYPVLDGNVKRVFSRFFLEKSNQKLEQIANSLIGQSYQLKNDPSSFNQSLMELGALVCNPQNPTCLSCPLKKGCGAFKKNLQPFYPQLTKKNQTEYRFFALLMAVKKIDGSIKFLVRKRSQNEQWLKELWEFPMIQLKKDLKVRNKQALLKEFFKIFSQQIKCKIRECAYVGNFFHSITHHRLKIHVVKSSLDGSLQGFGPTQWVANKDLKKIASSSILKKALAL
ncbi:MAG: A/G-specific adenine glycosylase [Elusimicrobia bacterium]|nr:A/G-specific adenine glycosylase [Elusimicrobiota bacterium]